MGPRALPFSRSVCSCRILQRAGGWRRMQNAARERPNGPCVLGVERPNGPKHPKRLGDNVTQAVAAFRMHLQPPYCWRTMQQQTQGEAPRARVPSALLPSPSLGPVGFSCKLFNFLLSTERATNQQTNQTNKQTNKPNKTKKQTNKQINK